MTSFRSKIPRLPARRFFLGTAMLLGLAAFPLRAEPQYIIEIKDHKFVPAELAVPAGTRVRILLINRDETQEEFESYSLNREKHLPPRSQVTIFIGPLDAGRYVFEGENRSSSRAAALGVIVAR